MVSLYGLKSIVDVLQNTVEKSVSLIAARIETHTYHEFCLGVSLVDCLFKDSDYTELYWYRHLRSPNRFCKCIGERFIFRGSKLDFRRRCLFPERANIVMSMHC